MKKLTFLFSLILLISFLSNFNCQFPDKFVESCAPCTVGNKCDDNRFTQIPFPSKYDYLPGSPLFEQWVNRIPDTAGHLMRKHAWNIWAGLNQPVNEETDRVIWQTWKTATQAFQDLKLGKGRPVTQKLKENSDYPAQNPSINRQPPNYIVPQCIQDKYGIGSDPAKISTDGCRFQFNGDLMIAGVIYNEPAYNWIRNKTNSLYLKRTLNRLIQENFSDIPSFPDSSIVLKPMMWPIKKEGFTALPVWDNLSPDSTAGNMKYAGFENKDFWKRAVAVTANDTSGSKVDSIRFLHSVLKTGSTTDSLINIYENVNTVNLHDNFYYWQIGEKELNSMRCQDRLILDLCAWWTYGRLFEPNDYIALIAMHIFTKEFPDWTMQTVWWHDQPDKGRFSSHRPSSQLESIGAQGPWDKYLMVSTYGQKQKSHPNESNPPHYCNVPDADTDNCWPVAYNPYIELGGRHPIATNCRNCHFRAGWTRDNIATNYLAKGGPTSLEYFDSTNTLLFNNVIRTDFQWAIPDRVLPNVVSPD